MVLAHTCKRGEIVSISCTRSHIATTKQKMIISKIRKKMTTEIIICCTPCIHVEITEYTHTCKISQREIHVRDQNPDNKMGKSSYQIGRMTSAISFGVIFHFATSGTRCDQRWTILDINHMHAFDEGVLYFRLYFIHLVRCSVRS